MAGAVTLATKAYKVYETVNTVKNVKAAIKAKKFGKAIEGIGAVGDAIGGDTGTSMVNFSKSANDAFGQITGTGAVGSSMAQQSTSGKDWLGGDARGTLKNVWKYGGMAAGLAGFDKQYQGIKKLKGTKLEIPSMDDFERNRDEMMDILGTDPDQLSERFDMNTLRKHGLDPNSIDAQAMLQKRGFMARQEQQHEEMSRQFARSGMMGSSAMAAAQAQLGIQGAFQDAQMGAEADRLFTQQLANLQQKQEGATRQLMSMEESMARWEMEKQQSVIGMERQFLDDVQKFTRKAKLGLEQEEKDEQERLDQEEMDAEEEAKRERRKKKRELKKLEEEAGLTPDEDEDEEDVVDDDGTIETTFDSEDVEDVVDVVEDEEDDEDPEDAAITQLINETTGNPDTNLTINRHGQVVEVPDPEDEETWKVNPDGTIDMSPFGSDIDTTNLADKKGLGLHTLTSEELAMEKIKGAQDDKIPGMVPGYSDLTAEELKKAFGQVNK